MTPKSGILVEITVIRPQWRHGPEGLAHTTVVIGRRLDPNRHWIPAAQKSFRLRLLVDDDAMHDGFGAVGIGALQ